MTLSAFLPISLRQHTLLALLLAAFLGSAPVRADSAEDNRSRAMDQFIRGTIADEMEDYYRAVFHYQEALRFDSAAPFIYVALAQDYILLGNPALAGDLLDRALRIDPEHVPALELKVVLLRGSGRLVAARDAQRKLCDLRPDNPHYLRQLLMLDLTHGRFDDADAHYRRLVILEGESELLIRQLLAIYAAAGEHTRALKLLNELIAQDSTDAGLAYALGATCLQTGDTARGEAYIIRATQLEPGDVRFWTGRALLALDRGAVDETIAVIDSALARAGETASLLALKGTALNRNSRKSEAVIVLERALELDSASFAALGALALIYDELDSLERAVALYEQAIRLSDSAAVYLNNLAYTFAVRGIALARARQLSARSLEMDPENGSYLDTMGWIEFQFGNDKAALRWLLKALKHDSGSAATLEHVGDVYRKRGSAAKARKYYRRGLDLDPENESLRQKLEK